MPGRHLRREIPDDIKEEYDNLKASYNNTSSDLRKLNEEREEILRNALNDIDIKRSQLQSKLNRLEKAMDILFPKPLDDYNKELPWKDKITWVLRGMNKLSPASTIISKIRMLENNFEGDLGQVIRLTIRRMEAKDEMILYENENLQGKYYGLPEWFNDDNSLKETYYF